MATVSFANLDQPFNMYNEMVTFTGGIALTRAPTNYSWYTVAGMNDVEFDGTGFTYNPASPYQPTGGTVTQFRLDFDSDSATTPELRITGLSFDLALLAPLANGTLTPEQQHDLIWRTLLSGNDTINLGNAGNGISVAGDGRDVGAGALIIGGNDTFTGSISGGSSTLGASGDIIDIAAGGTVYGGDDKMTVTVTGTKAITGDAVLTSGFLVGGNDTMTVTVGAGGSIVYGDSYAMSGPSAVVIGGNDVITVLSDAGVSVRGDTYAVATGTNLIGGNDTITGTAQSDNLVGEAVSVEGTARGGNDTLYGGGGGDYLYGDFTSVSGNAVGGNDALYGGAGADNLYGDTETGTMIGGNDTLIGGDGADHIYGNGGDDSIRGDAGADVIDGGAGFDTVSYQYGTGATINVPAGTATDGEGFTDTFANVEQWIGSAYYRDVFTASFLVQYFAGLGGNDYVIDNGDGADVFNGGDGFDTVSFYNRTAASVNLAAGTAVIGGETTTIIAFEEVYGSNTAGDTIVGDANNNTFWGFGGNDVLVGGRGLDTLSGGGGNDTFGFNASDLQAGVWDVISDFHEVANTDRDILYFNGVAGSSLVVGQANGGVYVSTTALGGNGGVFIANFTAAQLSDQLMFT